MRQDTRLILGTEQPVQQPQTTTSASVGAVARAGVPVGGIATEILTKNGPADYDAVWAAPASVSISWGDINGTVSDQTDLQAELDAKAALSHSHIIGDVTGLAEELMNDLSLAERVIQTTYGDSVSISDSGKALRKFGRNDSIGNSFETVYQLPSGPHETFVTTNVIDSVVSSSASDTQTIEVQGHTVDGSGNMTFVVQEATLTGQTAVTLGTALARVSRIRIQPSDTFGTTPAAAAGAISCYESSGGVTAGVPDDDTTVHANIQIGDAQTEQCATTISQSDYWILTFFAATIGDAANNVGYVTVRMEIRDIPNGGAWLPLGRSFTLVPDTGHSLRTPLTPPIIVPKNHDWRVIAETDANTAEVYAEAGGYLAIVE